MENDCKDLGIHSTAFGLTYVQRQRHETRYHAQVILCSSKARSREACYLALGTRGARKHFYQAIHKHVKNVSSIARWTDVILFTCHKDIYIISSLVGIEGFEVTESLHIVKYFMKVVTKR